MKKTVLSSAAAIAFLVWLIAMMGSSFAQEWKKLRDEGANFYDIQRNFYQHYQEQAPGQVKEDAFEGEGEGQGGGYTQFKRWEYWMVPRVYPSGILPAPDQDARAFSDYLQSRGVFTDGVATPAFMPEAIPSANWTSLGPVHWVTTSNSTAPGLGRISAIAFHPTNSNIIFLGTPAGGLWKSVDGGLTWSTNTDNLMVLGVSSIVFDPNNANIMYMATGDNDADHTPSLGVLKSIDGGATWNTTGLSWAASETKRIYKLLMHPTNSSILLAATTDGLYKTSDGGATWSKKLTSTWKDIEFKPGDPTVVYAAWSTKLYRSTNTGDNWASISLPSSAMNRFAIAVTPANANYVYVLASKSADNSFLGLYRSTDSGVTWTTRSTTPNILGYEVDGSDATKGQGFYDLALTVSPTNAEDIYTGGVNIWRSTNGGTTWINRTSWKVYINPAAYVHADVHILKFNGSTLYTGTDGGFFKSTDNGLTWTDLSAGMNITQYYRIGSDPSSANLVYGGAQDNTISRYIGSGIWESFISGDGAECIVDPTDHTRVYVSTQGGSLKRTYDDGANFYSMKNNINEDGAWVTPFVIDPVSSTTLYAGYVNVWKTTNSTSVPTSTVSWTNISNGQVGTGTFKDLQVAPSNSNYIYGVKTDKVYRTTNGGTSWSEITSGLPTAAYTWIAVSSQDPLKIWITMSGYSNGNKVWASTNGGNTWANYSGTLPNLPFNTIVYHNNGGTDALYAGADIGVYYRDNTMADWELYQTGLPNVPINELEVHTLSGKLRAGTFGRGLWETPLVPATVPGAALAFDGVNDNVSAPGFSWATGGPITVEFWAYVASADVPRASCAFSIGNQDNPNRAIVTTPDIDNMVYWDYGNQLADGRIGVNFGSQYQDKWTHFAVVSEGNGGNFKAIYLDGVLVASAAVSDGPDVPLSGLWTGSWPLVNYNHKGQIDEFRVWSYVRSAAEINATKDCELAGTEPGLTAYYKFNHGIAGGNNAGVTTLTDFSTNTNDGTLNNFALSGATSNWSAPGGVASGTSCPPLPPASAALAFDGVDDIVSAPGVSWPTGGAVTVEFWTYRASGDATNRGFFTLGDQLSPNIFRAWFNTELVWNYGAGLAANISTDYMSYEDKWTHVALVSEGTGGSFKGIYIDGVLVASAGTSAGPTGALSGLFVGSVPAVTSWSPYSGQIDEFRIWDHVRSVTEINAAKDCELTGTEAGLVAYYKFNHGLPGANNAGETTLDDFSTNNNDGTLQNFALSGTTSNWSAPGGVVSGMSCTIAAPLAANAGGDHPHSGGATKLKGSASGGNGAYTYAWAVLSGPNVSSAQFSNASAKAPIFTPTATGAYRLSLTVNDGMNPPASDETDVIVNTLFTVSISGDDPVDPGSLHSYTANSDATGPTTHLWSATNGTITEDVQVPPIGGGDPANTKNPVLVEAGIPQSDMLLEVYVTDGVTNDVVYALKSVSITNPLALFANAGADRTIPAGASIILGGSPAVSGGVPPFVYEWSPTAGLNDPTVANPISQPVTTTTYTLNVSDGYNTIATDQVTVTVTTVSNAYGNLLNFIAGLNIDNGLKNALSSKIKNSQKSFEKGNTNAAINQLNAFINQVEAQRGKKLTNEQADALIAQAQALIEAINAGGDQGLSKDPASGIPETYALEQNYPNPFNPTTTIRFSLPEAASVTLRIYNSAGQLVKTLASGNMEAGYHNLLWNATDESGTSVASGFYFYKLQAGNFTQVRKMLLLK